MKPDETDGPQLVTIPAQVTFKPRPSMLKNFAAQPGPPSSAKRTMTLYLDSSALTDEALTEFFPGIIDRAFGYGVT